MTTGAGTIETNPWASPEASSSGRLPMSATARAINLSLDGRWDFQLLTSPNAPVGDVWTSIVVPGSWTMQGVGDTPHYTAVRMPFAEPAPGTPAHNPTGVYRRRFSIPGEWGDDQVVLRVGAAESVVIARLNGILLGMGKDSHLASEFSLDGALHEGENELELVVIKYSDASHIEDQDHWRHGGITRSVGLVRVPRTHLRDVRVAADFDSDGGTGSLSVAAFVGGSIAEGWTVRASVAGLCELEVPASRLSPAPPSEMIPDGALDVMNLRAVGVALSPEAIGLAAAVSDFMFPPDPESVRLVSEPLDVTPWSDERPVLYTSTVELCDPERRVVDRVTTRVGFRRVEIRGRDLLLNGRRVLFRGVNRHDFDPVTGRAVAAENVRVELSLLKRIGVNAIRTAHYPNDPVVLDTCDELGLLVLAEANVESHAQISTVSQDSRYTGAILDRVSRMASRDVNHPSVVVWSLGNESGYAPVHDAAAAWLRHFDPTRPVQYEGALSQDWFGGHRASDIVCPMYAPVSAIVAYASDPRADRPLILCEYQHAMGNSNGGLAEYWAAFESTPGLQGGFIWEFRDHALDPDGDGRSRYGGDFGDEPNDGSYCIDGVVAADLTPHPVVEEMRTLFAPLRVVDQEAVTPRLRSTRLVTTTADLRIQARAERASGSGAWLDIPFPVLAPGEEAEAALPPEFDTPDLLSVSLRVVLIDDTPWAAAGTELAILCACRRARRRFVPAHRGGPALQIDDQGLLRHPLLRTGPRAAFWRSPTDNDRSPFLSDRFRRQGLDRLNRELIRIERRDDTARVTAHHLTPDGARIVHITELTPIESGIAFSELVQVPDEFFDLLRVGVRLETVPGFETASWLGLGPHESYPDRAASARPGRWQASVDHLAEPYLRPQENGGRSGVTELSLVGPAGTLELRADRPLQVNAARFAPEDLDAARHWWELIPRDTVIVHLDIAHRGVGTAAVGPDTACRFGAGEYRWNWELHALAALA